MKQEVEYIPAKPRDPDGWAPHPRKVMLMTPLMVVVGGLIAFFTVVTMVVFLPVTTFEPPPSENWRPLTAQETRGRDLFLANGCFYCHSGFTRPQDYLAGQYYVYPRVSEPGDFSGPGESPNMFGSARTGPDLSQAGGFHPDDWHYAHYYNPRFVTPLSVMPSFQFMNKEDLLALVADNQARGGKLADLRALHQNNVKALEFSSNNVEAKTCPGDPCPDGFPAPSAIKNLMLIERGYWLEDNPLAMTTENLLRGRQIYEERCIGCHGSQGDGNGPAAFYLNPPPAPFNVADDQAHGTDTSPGSYYWRVLRGLPGTAMENFGTRLSVEDIWRVILFLKTIPNGGLTAEVPTPDLYVQWEGYPGLYQWADCFLTNEEYFKNQAQFKGAPDQIGDVPGIVGVDAVNPTYAVILWEVNKNARPCVSKGYEKVTFEDIMAEASQRTDGYARQNVDLIKFIPPSMIDMSQMPPQWLDQVWGKPNPGIEPGAGNE